VTPAAAAIYSHVLVEPPNGIREAVNREGCPGDGQAGLREWEKWLFDPGGRCTYGA
jgi:hypothetical protein